MEKKYNVEEMSFFPKMKIVFLLNLIFNSLYVGLYFLLMTKKWVNYPTGDKESLMYILKILLKDFNNFFTKDSISFLLTLFLLCGFIASIICIFKSVYNLFNAKHVVEYIIDIRRDCASYRKFSRRTGGTNYSIGIGMIVCVFVIGFIIQKSFNAETFANIGLSGLMSYFSTFYTFILTDTKMDTTILVFTIILIAASIVKGCYIFSVKNKLY